MILVHISASVLIGFEPRDVIIFQVVLLFKIKEIWEALNIKIFLHTDPDICFIRRLKRDITERGRNIEDVIEQYVTTVKPMHIEYVEPSKKFADLIIQDNGFDAGVDIIINSIKYMLNSQKLIKVNKSDNYRAHMFWI